MDKYLNVVREGSTVSDPSAFVLDTGEKLATRLITGAELAAAKITSEEPVKPTTQVVVISFPAVKKGQSIRLRISETYTAPASYGLEGDELVFDRKPWPPAQRSGSPGGLVFDRQRHSRDGHATAGRTHSARFLEWAA